MNPARARTQLFELAHSPLLPPGLLLRLANTIDGFCLLLVETEKFQAPRAPATVGSEIRPSTRTHSDVRAEDADAQRDLFQILPADVRDVEAAEQLARQADQPTA